MRNHTWNAQSSYHHGLTSLLKREKISSRMIRSLNPETAVGSQKSAQAVGACPRVRRIYCGRAGFGQIFRSFSLNRHHYSPQTIETSDSNQHPLATIPNLGQAPGPTWQNKKSLITTKVTTTFFISPCTPISYTVFWRPPAVSRLNFLIDCTDPFLL